MRMNLNQQSHGAGVEHPSQSHELDEPDRGLRRPLRRRDVPDDRRASRFACRAIGARLTGEIKPGMYNYGQLQVTFDDGSVGWYEAGWGPMMSEVAFFVKDVIGPKGCVSIVKDPNESGASGSDDIDSHTKTNCIRLHRSDIDATERVRAGRTSSSTPRTNPITRASAIGSRRTCCAPSSRISI